MCLKPFCFQLIPINSLLVKRAFLPFLQGVNIVCYRECCTSHHWHVCLCVCHTLALCQNDAGWDQKIFTNRWYKSLVLAIQGSSRNSIKLTPSKGAFLANKSPWLRNGQRQDLGCYWSLIGSCIHAFDCRGNEQCWMTMNGHFTLLFKIRACFGAQHENVNEDRPTLSPAKCSPVTLSFWLCKVMWIFTVVPWRGGIKWLG